MKKECRVHVWLCLHMSSGKLPHDPGTGPHVYKSSPRGVRPCAVPILSSNQNLSLSTLARSAMKSLNSTGLLRGRLIRLRWPAGAGTSDLTLQNPFAAWKSLLRRKLWKSFAPSGWGASLRIAAVCAHVTCLPCLGNVTLKGLGAWPKPSMVVKDAT